MGAASPSGLVAASSAVQVWSCGGSLGGLSICHLRGPVCALKEQLCLGVQTRVAVSPNCLAVTGGWETSCLWGLFLGRLLGHPEQLVAGFWAAWWVPDGFRFSPGALSACWVCLQIGLLFQCRTGSGASI